MIVFLTNGYAQSTIVVKGIVNAQNGDPIAGASVVVKSTGKGTTTSESGSFQIEAPANGTLIITHTGFAGQEIKLSSTD